MKYILLVDESGDQGLEKVRTDRDPRGASPFMTLGAASLPLHHRGRLKEFLENISILFGGKDLHCNSLTHIQRSCFARAVSEQRVLLFAVISKKDTLGEYREAIRGDGQANSYYNKCSQYLLELVGHFMSCKGIGASDLSIVFEKKNHNYERLRRYLKAIQEKPIDDRAIHLKKIDSLSISAETKSREPLLALADLVAFSAHATVNKTTENFSIPEQRYFRELKNRFWKNDKGKIANFGVKYIRGPFAMGLTGNELSFALKLYKETSPPPPLPAPHPAAPPS